MRQFYDAYKGNKAAAPLVRHVSWSGNLLILSRCKSPEEREFYLRLAHREGWDKRETDRQLRGALFERAVLGRPRVSPAVTQLHPDAESIFKDSYLVGFLVLPEAHSEQELQTAIILNLKRFLLELGRDFAFVGEQYLLPVGEVVEYALSRAASPALIAEYQTRLPDRKTLQRKLHEFYELAKPGIRNAAKGATRRRRGVSAGGRKGIASSRARS
jgi:predicted nuclease of restriction endonuclease-like (RecB) superfamily